MLIKMTIKLNSNIIYVTHDQVEAMTLADRIVVLNKGNIEQFGTPTEIYMIQIIFLLQNLLVHQK